MINTTLSIKKHFKYQVTKFMKTTFSSMTQQHISKKKARVLELFMFYDTRQKKPKKILKVLSCVIYTIISNYVCIDYLGSESKKLSELALGSGGGFKHEEKSHDKILGIGIPDLLMNLMSCHGFLKNKNPVVILKFPKRMLEYYFSKGFTILECNYNNLAKLPNEVKQIIHAEDTDNSDKVMICSTTIPSTSNTLKNLAVNTSFHSSYIQK